MFVDSTPALILGSGEELKSNYVYGASGASPHLCTSTDLTSALENGRQVRSNTYDIADPHTNGATNGGTASSAAVPTYATIETARKEMLIAGGPAVLNPVYGPTGTSITPATSPIPTPSSKQAPNPIYSETPTSSVPYKLDSAQQHQLPVVSGLNPVYAGLGPGTQPLRSPSDPMPPRYANSSDLNASSRQLDNALLTTPPHSAVAMQTAGVSNNDSATGFPPAPPMYEELRPVLPPLAPTATETVTGGGGGGGNRGPMTTNESYGVLSTEQLTTSNSLQNST